MKKRNLFAELTEGVEALTDARTLEKWEQCRAKPNAQAAPLIKLVEQYPDNSERLASV